MKIILQKKKLSKILFSTILASLIMHSNTSITYANNSFHQDLDNVSYNKLEDAIIPNSKLQSGMYVVDSDLTLNDNTDNKTRTQNAIKIDDKSNVCIYIKKGATLTVYGQSYNKKNKASKKTGSAIFVPSSTTLSILGEGNLIAYGGEGKNEYLPSPAIGRNGCNINKTEPDEKYNNKIFFSDELNVKLYGGKYSIDSNKFKHKGKYEYLDNKLYNKNDKYLIPFNLALLGICNPYKEDGSNKDLEYRTTVYILDLNNNKSINKMANDKTFEEATIKAEYLRYVEDYLDYGGYNITSILKTNITNPQKVTKAPAPLPPKENIVTNNTNETSTNNGFKNLMLIVSFFTCLGLFVMVVYSLYFHQNHKR